jgi:CheY-like chemotaxis protein
MARVLLVEDSIADIELIKEVLIDCGLKEEPLVAKDGREALEIMAKGLPDLILLDLNLGIMGGLDFLRRIKILYPNYLTYRPVVVLTSSNVKEDVEEALTLGAKAYHVKPLSIVEFARLVQVLYAQWIEYNVLPDLP